MAEYFDVAMSKILPGFGRAGADAKLQEIARGVDQRKRDYLKLLVARGIDVPAAPDFAGDWKPLSQAWIARKKHSRYYFGMSESEGKVSLRQALLALPVENIFGRTQVYTSIHTKTASAYPGFTVRGRTIKTVYRNYKGQFQQAWKASPTMISYTVNAFPDISFMNKKDMQLGSMLGLDAEQARKLDYNGKLRPLAAPFTEWFFLSKIKPYIESEIKKL